MRSDEIPLRSLSFKPPPGTCMLGGPKEDDLVPFPLGICMLRGPAGSHGFQPKEQNRLDPHALVTDSSQISSAGEERGRDGTGRRRLEPHALITDVGEFPHRRALPTTTPAIPHRHLLPRLRRRRRRFVAHVETPTIKASAHPRRRPPPCSYLMEPAGHGAPQRMLSQAQHQYYWVSVPGNVNHTLSSPDAKAKMRADVVPKIELKRYVLEDKFKSRNEHVNQINDRLITQYNQIAEEHCDAIRTRADHNHNPARLAKQVQDCKNKVNECKQLQRQIINAGGRAVPIPHHF